MSTTSTQKGPIEAPQHRQERSVSSGRCLQKGTGVFGRAEIRSSRRASSRSPYFLLTLNVKNQCESRNIGHLLPSKTVNHLSTLGKAFGRPPDSDSAGTCGKAFWWSFGGLGVSLGP